MTWKFIKGLLSVEVFCLAWTVSSLSLEIPVGGQSLASSNTLWSAHFMAASPESASFKKLDGGANGPSVRVDVGQSSSQQSDTALLVPVKGPFQAGDVILLTFKARNSSSFRVPSSRFSVQIRKGGATSGEIASLPVRVESAWKTTYLPFRLRTPCPQLDIRFNLAWQEQTIDLAGLDVLNFGPDFSLKDLPQTSLTYEGRVSDAPWRKAAFDRIDQYRKGELTIRVVDEKQHPLTGAKVYLRMKRHRFHFGAAVTARLLQENSPDALAYRDLVERCFNTAVFENDLKPGTWQQSKTNTDPNFRLAWTEAALAWMNERNIR
ncbi:MAG: hypothetical protein V2A34_12110, partial [Lentisphaerota bacterium]